MSFLSQNTFSPLVHPDHGTSFHSSNYDIVIVGAGIAGSSLAYALAQDGRMVTLIERDLSEPDRIVGELMQPGGCMALESLDLADTFNNIDAIDVFGYVILDNDDQCHLHYPPRTPHLPHRGKSFHHGRFIMNLRRKCLSHPNISVIQATVTDLIRDLHEPRVVGVHAIARSRSSISNNNEIINMDHNELENHYEFMAPLTIIADGCFSKFRTDILGSKMEAPSHFVGFILHQVTLPMPNYGHVVLADPSPILLYQIGTNDTRILVDIPGSQIPRNQNGQLIHYLNNHVASQLPPSVRNAFIHAITTQRPRIMPNPYLPPRPQGHVLGLIMIGDAHNMRHPLTGGGMSVALNDVVILRDKLRQVKDLHTTDLRPLLGQWYWQRKSLSSVINILANALYSLFSSGSDPALLALRRATFDYLRLGGNFSNEPVRLLAAIAPQPLLLVRHFFQVAAFAAYHLIKTQPWWALPRTIGRQVKIFITSFKVIAPLCWYEIRGAPRHFKSSLDAIASRSRSSSLPEYMKIVD